MRPDSPEFTQRGLGFPRVSGDAPRALRVSIMSHLFSPRERGCAPTIEQLMASMTVFPA